MMTRNFNFGNFFCRKCENFKLLFSLKLPRQIREITTFLFTRLRHKRRTIGRVIIDVCVCVCAYVWVWEIESVRETDRERQTSLPTYGQMDRKKEALFNITCMAKRYNFLNKMKNSFYRLHTPIFLTKDLI
jgi:hypothetical protein